MPRFLRFAIATAAFSLASAAALRRRGPPRTPLTGKVVVVTGASSGIGRATALEAAGRGARVVLAARDRAALEQVAADARQLGAEALAVPTDVSDRAQVEALVRAAVAHFGRVDVMVNNAGGWFIDTVEHSDEARVRALIDTNVLGVLHGVQAVLPVMRQQGGGHIINTASVEGRVGFPFTGVYAGTKAFIEVMTQSLRQELMQVEGSGIRVSALLPAATRTPLFDDAPNEVAGGRGAHLVRPVQEASTVGRAAVDAMERYRPVIYPLPASKGVAVLYDLLPGLTDQVMARMRVDRATNPLIHKARGSHQEEKPITPTVEGGALQN